jgi:hypothetical protein
VVRGRLRHIAACGVTYFASKRQRNYDFSAVYQHNRNRVSSGSIVSDYGLDDRAIGVRSPAGAKDSSSSLCVQTGSGDHPASCTITMGPGVLSPGLKRGRGVRLTIHPHLVSRSRMSRSCTSSPSASMARSETAFLTMETKASTLLHNKNDTKAVM